MTKNLKFISDPGHGWLSVKLSDLKELGIEDKISSYSYMTLSRAYLEEDLDMSIYINAAKEKGWDLNIKDSHVDNTPIRNYSSYNKEKLSICENFEKGKIVALYDNKMKSFSIKATIVDIIGTKIYIDDCYGNRYKTNKSKILSVCRNYSQENNLNSKKLNATI